MLDNLASYADQVAHVYAVDNSEEPDPGVHASLSSRAAVTCLVNGTNLGIATALNQGARAALADGYSRLLTMDQDSTATPGLVRALVAGMDGDPRIALVSPVHQQFGTPPRRPEPGIRDVLTAMTSGNLLSLAAYRDLGGFMDDLFIDSVDHEFCLRLHRAGYRVVESGDAVLHHRLGRTRRHRFPWPCYTYNHSALRRYYIARNRLVVAEMYRADYPEYRAMQRVELARDAAKILLYEEHKCRKFQMILCGIRDYRRGALGPCPGR